MLLRNAFLLALTAGLASGSHLDEVHSSTPSAEGVTITPIADWNFAEGGLYNVHLKASLVRADATQTVLSIDCHEDPEGYGTY